MGFNMKDLAPVVLFVYNRPLHTRITLESLARNTLAAQTNLIVYSDAARGEEAVPFVNEVRAYLKSVTGFASITIICSEMNKGLADSIIHGVSETVRKYGKVIVLEDDIVTSPFFLQYMNDALNVYAPHDEVMHISGFMFDIFPEGADDTFFLHQASCWGWGTWERAWRHFNRDSIRIVDTFTTEDIARFNLHGAYDYWSQIMANHGGSLKTWAVFWYAAVFERRGLCLHPTKSMVANIGLDGSGENCGKAEHTVLLAERRIAVVPQPLSVSAVAESAFAAYLRQRRPSLLRRLLASMRRILARGRI